MARYWISPLASNWNNTANWSASSGGTSGASVPGPLDMAYFDSNGIGNCSADIDATANSIQIQTNILDLNGFNLDCSSISIGTDSTLRLQGKEQILFRGPGLDIANGTVETDGTDIYTNFFSGYNQFPTLHFNSPGTWTVDGTGPVRVHGNLIISDGTFNTNRLDVMVGNS